MEVPRHKHQTQPLYTAPRLSDRFDRVSPLNSRRSNADSYHDNKSSSLQSQRSGSKSLRRHSTNAYTSSNSSTNTNTSSSSNASNQKELSPTSGGGGSLQHQMNNNSSRLVRLVSFTEKKTRFVLAIWETHFPLFFIWYSNSSSREGIPNIHHASSSMNNANNQKNKKMPKRKRVTGGYPFENNGGNGGNSAAISVNAIQKLNKQAQQQQQQAQSSNSNVANSMGKSLKMGATNRWLMYHQMRAYDSHMDPLQFPKQTFDYYAQRWPNSHYHTFEHF